MRTVGAHTTAVAASSTFTTRCCQRRCDCVICLPGGVGTLDETFEAAALLHTGLWSWRPICLVNVDGYYDGTMKQLQRAQVRRANRTRTAEPMAATALPSTRAG